MSFFYINLSIYKNGIELSDLNRRKDFTMSEENKALEQSQETQTAESEANKTENKQEPKTITRTQEEDNELFKREAGKAKNSVYSKLGVKDEAEFSALLSKLSKINEAEAEAERNKPEIERLKGEVSALSKVDEDNKALSERVAKYELDEIIRGKGINDPKETKLAIYEIRELMNAGKEMKEAAEEYFKVNPSADAPPKPEIQARTSPSPVTQSEADKIKSDYKEAVKQKRWSIVSALTRTAKEKNIKLEE